MIAYASQCHNELEMATFCFAVDRPSTLEPPVVSEVHARSCTVTYQPPSDDGGAPVTGYVLERCTPGPDSKWIRVNHTPVPDLQYTISNLTSATEYEFHVAVVNKERMGFFSPQSLKIMTGENLDKPDHPAVVSQSQVS